MSLKDAFVKALRKEAAGEITPLFEEDAYKIYVRVENVRESGARVISLLRDIINQIETYKDIDGTIEISIADKRTEMKIKPRRTDVSDETWIQEQMKRESIEFGEYKRR